MINKASLNDLPKIMTMIKTVITFMNEREYTFWNENYPSISHFKKDIESESLYVCKISDNVVGTICINSEEAEEYKKLNWNINDKKYVIHRLSVHPEFRGQKIGDELLRFAEELAENNCIKTIKTDTNVINISAQKLFERNGYKKVGVVSFKGHEGRFLCYEKVL